MILESPGLLRTRQELIDKPFRENVKNGLASSNDGIYIIFLYKASKAEDAIRAMRRMSKAVCGVSKDEKLALRRCSAARYKVRMSSSSMSRSFLSIWYCSSATYRERMLNGNPLKALHMCRPASWFRADQMEQTIPFSQATAPSKLFKKRVLA